MAEIDEFKNVDADADPEDEDSKAAKAIWVRVANSTEYAMQVESFTDRAKRQEAQGIYMILILFLTVNSGIKVAAEISVPIPGFEINPAINVRSLFYAIL